jgi:phthiodiolone/phenolphthiodiolone dimycocerosates ketoreductase
VARLEEALAIIRRLWESNGDPVDYDGTFWTLRDAVFRLPLYRGRPPRLFVAAHFPRMLRLTGRFADGWLPGQKVSATEYQSRLKVIATARAEASRSHADFLPTQTLLVALGDTRAAVLERAMRSPVAAAMTLGAPGAAWSARGLVHPLGADHGGFLDLVPTRVTAADVDRALATMRPELLTSQLYIGNVDQIVEEVAPLVGAGCRHFIVANVGASFMGDGARGLARQASLMRKLRKL